MSFNTFFRVSSYAMVACGALALTVSGGLSSGLALAFAVLLGVALPLFLIVPRSASSALARTGDGSTGFVGFSDSVSLGDVGRLQQSDRLVMRVRVDDAQGNAQRRSLRW